MGAHSSRFSTRHAHDLVANTSGAAHQSVRLVQHRSGPYGDAVYASGRLPPRLQAAEPSRYSATRPIREGEAARSVGLGRIAPMVYKGAKPGTGIAVTLGT